MVSEVYMICDAYESGVGWGKSGRVGHNPYGTSGEAINAQCHEAWQHGYEFGLESIGLAGEDWYAKQRNEVESVYRETNACGGYLIPKGQPTWIKQFHAPRQD